MGLSFLSDFSHFSNIALKPPPPAIMSDRPKSLISETELQSKKNEMKDVETKELQRLPTADDIALEKEKGQLNAQIAAGKELKKVEMKEKVLLPTKEDIEAEKKAAEEEAA